MGNSWEVQRCERRGGWVMGEKEKSVNKYGKYVDKNLNFCRFSLRSISFLFSFLRVTYLNYTLSG